MLSKNQIRNIQNLHLKKFRDAEKKFIAEGVKTVLEIVNQEPGIVEAVYAIGEFGARHSRELSEQGIVFTEITETDLKKLSMQVTPNQALAVCRYFDKDDYEKAAIPGC